MNKQLFMKRNIILILCFISLIIMDSCHRRVVNNPYLKMKVKPSQEMNKEDAKNLRRERKEYKKEIKEAKKEAAKKDEKFTENKKHFHFYRKKKNKQQTGNF